MGSAETKKKRESASQIISLKNLTPIVERIRIKCLRIISRFAMSWLVWIPIPLFKELKLSRFMSIENPLKR